jgi:hypothetical protein
MSSRSPHVSGPSSTTATELNRAQAATATASPARGAHPHRHSCWVTLTPARTSPSSLPLPSPWWRCAGQHPLEHRGASTRRIGGDPARGGVVSRSVPGFLFPMGGFGGEQECSVTKIPSSQNLGGTTSSPRFYLVPVKHGNNSQFEKDIS